MPLAQMLHSLGNFAASLVPSTRPARSLEIATFDEADAFERAAIGRWATDDGTIVIELRPDGRYNKAKQTLSTWHHGRFQVDRSHLYFESDSGHLAKGEMRRGVLSIGEMQFHRARATPELNIQP
jgi:hypothetical protein